MAAHGCFRAFPLLSAVVLALAAWPLGATAAEVTVRIKDYAFVPAIVEIAPGDTVVWVNADDTPHNVLAQDKAFKSPPLDTGETYRRTFDQAGNYDYLCQLHPHMKGRVVVR